MKTRHSKQVLVGLSVFSDGVLHFLQIKKNLFTEIILWPVDMHEFVSSFYIDNFKTEMHHVIEGII